MDTFVKRSEKSSFLTKQPIFEFGNSLAVGTCADDKETEDNQSIEGVGWNIWMAYQVLVLWNENYRLYHIPVWI